MAFSMMGISTLIWSNRDDPKVPKVHRYEKKMVWVILVCLTATHTQPRHAESEWNSTHNYVARLYIKMPPNQGWKSHRGGKAVIGSSYQHHGNPDAVKRAYWKALPVAPFTNMD